MSEAESSFLFGEARDSTRIAGVVRDSEYSSQWRVWEVMAKRKQESSQLLCRSQRDSLRGSPYHPPRTHSDDSSTGRLRLLDFERRDFDVVVPSASPSNSSSISMASA